MVGGGEVGRPVICIARDGQATPITSTRPTSGKPNETDRLFKRNLAIWQYSFNDHAFPTMAAKSTHGD
ncbi:unnamed protein product [Toxocara canis]|uniref:Piwi domain-containing protein n=1 Tax=Toxocara canis TaxID=6265 RepID=A0A183V682_TOXCA|nr:unnamed protein product [Toxocara canis]